MTKSNRDSVREYRARKAAEGGRPISVWLEPQTLLMLDALRKHFGKSKKGKNAPLVVKAIHVLYKSIINQ
jgi:hypothetical protein